MTNLPAAIVDEQLLGPVGLTVALIVAVVFLARVLFKFVWDYIQQLKADLKTALDGWKEQTEANRILAEAQASRNRDDEMRHRLQDAQGKKVLG
jgi:hypothetical protein